MKALNRKEQFFNYILGKTTSKPKPMTREEKILDEFKPTMVVNMTVDTSNYSAVCDKTFAEMNAHIDDGGEVIAYLVSGNETITMAISSRTKWAIRFVGHAVSPSGDGTNTFGSYMIHCINIGNALDGSDDVGSYARKNLLS